MTGILQTAFKGLRPEPCQSHLDIPYAKDDHPRQKMDVFLPPRRGPFPLIIYIHGGGFVMGSKSDKGVPSYLTTLGYAVASLDYRYSSDAPFPAQFEDCMAAVRLLRKCAPLFRLDPCRFLAWGESSGGHLASLLGLAACSPYFDCLENREASPCVQGVIDFAGGTDLLRMDSQAIAGAPKASASDSFESLLVGGSLESKRGLATLASPLLYVDKNAPPFLVAHGDQDRAVPIGQSKALVEALRAAGAYVEYHSLKGADHKFQGGDPRALVRLEEESYRFLDLVFSGKVGRVKMASAA